jgi:uncharacterized HAD superfamily protein
MNIALDIDGTISEHPEFFASLSSMMRHAGHRVVILTYRDPNRSEATRTELSKWQVVYDDLVFAPSLAGKGQLCRELAIDLFFDDQDECIVGVPESVFVFKLRNGGNFDYEKQRWISTAQLTDLI